MVKSKNKINQIDTIKSNKKLKLDKVVKDIKDITSLFDNIKKGIKDSNVDTNNDCIDLKTKTITCSNSISSNNNTIDNKTIGNNDITTYGIMKKNSSYSSSSGSCSLSSINKRKKDDLIEDSRIYGIIKSNIKSSIINPEAPLERIDKESGLPVYKAHLLKVGEGGGEI